MISYTTKVFLKLSARILHCSYTANFLQFQEGVFVSYLTFSIHLISEEKSLVEPIFIHHWIFIYNCIAMANLSTSCVLSEDEVGESEIDMVFVEGNEDITVKERIILCCKPKYQVRKLNNKGAIIVLTWNFLVTSVFYYMSRLTPGSYNYCSICFKLTLIPIGVVITFAGWLADVRFGRYKVIYWSSLLMWMSAVLLVICLIVTEELDLHKNYFQLILLGTLGIGYGGFHSNLVQFGIDQLIDASTDEIKSFINWFAWSFVSSGAVARFVSSCTNQQYKLILPFLTCVSLSVVISIIFLCNHVLIKEPVTRNPFKLIHQVTSYALKTKYPQQRSAFTYCEDDIPSRLDFGKSKYGGPFTTEQVEDVKTFFRSIGIVVIVGAVFGMTDEKTYLSSSSAIITSQGSQGHTIGISKCFLKYIFTDTYYVTVAFSVPLNEFVIHPLFHRCLPNVRSYWRVCLGIMLHVGKYGALIALSLFANGKSLHTGMRTNDSAINQCPFQESLFHNGSNDYYMLLAVPEIVSAISFMLILIGIIKVFCSQVPYSMKGLMVGIFYGSLVLFLLINNGLSELFMLNSTPWRLGDIFSCRVLYLVIKMICQLIATVSILSVVGCYTKRKREDVLPSEHIFAERYYSS